MNHFSGLKTDWLAGMRADAMERQRERVQPEPESSRVDYMADEELVAEWLESMKDDRDYMSDIHSEMMSDPDFVRTLTFAALNRDAIDPDAWLVQSLRVRLTDMWRDAAIEWKRDREVNEMWEWDE